MHNTARRRSPVHEALALRGAEWLDVDGMPVAVRVQSEESERAAMKSLAICDLSGLTKLGIKGHGAQAWLFEQDVEVPANVYASRPLADGGLIARFGTEEFFLESGFDSGRFRDLMDRLESRQDGLIRIERQEATFELVGTRALDVLAQVCGINFREADSEHVVFTRVAAVSCGILPHTIRAVPAYRLWVDFSYALYLWETVVEICESLDGGVIGAGCLFPEVPA